MHRWLARWSGLFVALAVVAACSAGPSPTAGPSATAGPPAGQNGSVVDRPLRFVALGDSYTIGTSVAEAERWPNLLVERLGPARLRLVANLGVNGYTSGDVIDAELPRLAALQPEFVSLLVGVNDVVQGVPAAVFAANAAAILDALLAMLPADRIVTVATPDYTVTPRGASFGDPGAQRAGIERNNATLRALAEARGIAYVDIFDASRLAATDLTLVARDGLHPSGTQYARWVDRIAPVVSALLGA